jgi:hypothetical protein
MRTVEQYLEKTVDFDAFSATSSNEIMRKRFADIAACYRLLARDRERLVAMGAIPQEQIHLTDMRKDEAANFRNAAKRRRANAAASLTLLDSDAWLELASDWMAMAEAFEKEVRPRSLN